MKCCPSGVQVLDECFCCPVCAKAEYESCGGLWGFEGTCATGFYCKGEIEFSYGGFQEDGICTKLKHSGQYQNVSDNPEWHKTVPICDTPTNESANA